MKNWRYRWRLRIGGNRQAQKRMKTLVADTVAVEPVSAGVFPGIREKNRDRADF
jgi:hypothetical protein